MDVFKTQIIHQSFSDFDELTNAAQAWNLELCKLDAGSFRGEMFQLIAADFILSRGRFNCRVKQGGEPPVGYRTFAIPAYPELTMLWRGKPVTGNDLLIFPVGGELHAFSEPNFDVFTLSFSETLLEKFVEIHRFEGVEVLPSHPASMDSIRNLLHQTIQGVANLEKAKDSLLHQLAQLLTKTCQRQIAYTPHSRRIQTLLHAERFVIANPGEAPSVKDLCAATGVSKRTLEYAFSSHLGISPKAYINAVRLNGVRQQLRGAQPGHLRVADSANAWGFWHMGQFAADYRKLFGENPSVTLGCDAQPCKATCPYRNKCLICREP